MINNIVDIFRTQALEHRAIQVFYYNRNYELGNGKDKYPLFWLEDPIRGKNQDNLFVNSVNFSILFLPTTPEMVVEMQNLAFSAGLNIIERIKKDECSPMHIRPDWTYMTLQNYYDNNACGCRFSLNFNQVNMQDLCLIEDQFSPIGDKDKEASPLPSFEVFSSKLPDFNLRTRKSQKE